MIEFIYCPQTAYMKSVSETFPGMKVYHELPLPEVDLILEKDNRCVAGAYTANPTIDQYIDKDCCIHVFQGGYWRGYENYKRLKQASLLGADIRVIYAPKGEGRYLSYRAKLKDGTIEGIAGTGREIIKNEIQEEFTPDNDNWWF